MYAKAATLESLPLQVYHQVQQWKGLNLQPQEWGWELRSGKLLPLQTNLPPHIRHCLRSSVAAVRQTVVLKDVPAGRMAWTALLLAERAEE